MKNRAKKLIRNLLFAAFATIVLGQPASSQNLFAVAAKVNDRAVTNYEVMQRVVLMDVLLPGTGDFNRALDALIDERLQLSEAEAAGIRISARHVTAGIEELASRASMSADEFTDAIASSGVAAETLRDYVFVGLAWRDLIRQRYGAKAGVIDAEIGRAITFAGTTSSLRVLISEIFLPTHTEEFAAISHELAPQIAALNTIPEFSDAARQYSAGATRSNGGRVQDWIPVANLPAALQAVVMEMSPGDISQPIEFPNAIAIFQLRAIQEFQAPAARNPRVEWIELPIDAEGAEKFRNSISTCDAIYGRLSDRQKEQLVRNDAKLENVATDVALELAKLDPGESIYRTTADGSEGQLLMLCARQNDGGAEPDRTALQTRLANQKLSAYADQLLAALRVQAKITRK